MKRKLLFITLLMLFCSTIFGQKPNWTAPYSGNFEGNMTIAAYFEIYGVEQFSEDIEFAAFCGDELRGVGSKPTKINDDHYVSVMTIHGNNNDNISFKIWDPKLGEILSTSYTKRFLKDDVLPPFAIDFYETYWNFVRNMETMNESMTIINTTSIDGTVLTRRNFELAAFYGNELRGVGRQDEEGRTYFTIFGDADETGLLTFKLYDHETDQLMDITSYSIPFEAGGIYGDYDNPEMINFSTKPFVAKVENTSGNTYYTTLEAALKALTENATLTILEDITISSDWDCRYTGAKITVPVTINGNGKTIEFTGKINDGYNHLAAFRFEAPVTVNNLTVDMSEAVAVFQNRFSAISTKANLTVNESKFIGSTTYANSRAIIFGEGGHEGLEIVVNETEFINWKYGVVDNMNGGDVKSVTITGNTFNSADVVISAKETVTFTGNDMSSNSYVNITSYTVPNNVAVTATGNTNLAANTETEYNQIVAPTIVAQDGFLTPVAEAGGQYYVTLQGAVDAAKSNETVITMIDNVSITKTVEVLAGQNITLDLNGKTIDGTGKVGIAIMSDGNLTIKDSTTEKNGTIKAGIGTGGNTINVCAGTFTFESGNIYSKNNAILIDEEAAIVNIKGGTITAEPSTNNSAAFYISSTSETTLNITAGTMKGYNGILLWNNTEINITGGSIEATGSVAIQGNGTCDNTLINIGGEETSVKGYYAAIYHPQNGELNITNGTLEGWTGVVVKSGKVTISGGTINGIGTANEYRPASSGFVDTGDALYVEHYDNSTNSENYGTPVVTVTGGTFNSTNAHPIASYANPNNASNGVEALAAFVEGGTFNKEIASDLIAPGFKLEANTDGTYGVVEDPEYGMQAMIVKDGTTTYYATIADAITAAQPGETVTILDGNYTTDITINKAITVEGETDEQDNNLVNITGRVSAYTGATVKNLNVNNTKTGDYDCALNVNGKDIVVDGVKLTGHNAMRYCYASGNITIKNSTINGSNFAVHFDGSEGGNILFENTVIIGWASYASTVNNVSYTGCYFDQGNYSGHRYYNKNISFYECTFNAGLLIDLKASGSNVAFTDADMTVADVKALFTNPYYVANGNVTLNGNPVLYAASANSKYYNTLQECIDDLPADGTNWYVTLRSDNVLTAPITIPADKKMTFALNGFDITYTSDVQGEAMITNNGVLTIEGGNEDKVAYKFTGAPDTNYGKGNYTIYNNGTLTVESGIVENTTDAMSHASYAINTGAGATLNIKGGKVLNLNGHAVRMVSFGTNVNNVYITGGYIEGTRALQVQLPGGATSTTKPEMNLSISGGELKSNEETYNLAIYVYSNGQSAENLNVALAGGTFNGNVAINEVATKTMKEDAVKVTNGTFNGAYGVFSYADNAVAVPVISITGGSFATDYSEAYALDDGYEFVKDETTGRFGLQQLQGLTIFTLNELIAFRDAVNAGNDFAGQTVVLKSEYGIDLSQTRSIENWIPIGTIATPFKGTFDGGNVTISNLVVEGENNVGLFGYATEATIKNITIDNATVTGKTAVGAIAGNLFRGNMDNCHVTGLVQIDGKYKVGGLIGGAYSNVRNSSLIADDNSYVKGTHVEENLEGDNVGGITGYNGEGTYTYSNNTVKNVTISGTRKVGGILGFIFEDAKVEGSVVENVTIKSTSTEEYANANVGKMSIGGIIGQYQKHGNNDGYVNSSFVKNVTFLNSSGLNFQVGPLVGGTRGNADFVPSATVTSEGNTVYMTTVTGSNNLFLMNAVAKIGETKYYTLFDAVKAAQGETTTITLISNTSEEFAIDNTATAITLDLNGKELTGAILPSNAKLTVKNGTINNTNADYSAIEINAGELNLENVIISSARHAVRIDGAVEATINGGEYTLTATSGTRHAVNVSGGAEVTITAGTFVGPKGTTMDSGSAVCVQKNSKVTIEGGDFSKGKNYTLSADGTLTVKGGTFDQDPSAYLAPGYVAEKTGNVWTVKLMTTEFFYTAAGTVTTADATDAVYSLMFTITDNANKEVSVKIGSMKPANNSKAVLVIPATVAFNGVNETFKVTAIEDDAFNTCRNFVGDLTLPQYVRTIGDRAFNTCHYITNPEHPKGKLTLNEGLTSIGSQAFTNSYFTDGLSIPRSVTMIEPNAFQYAKIKGALTINSDVECALAFNSSEFTKVEIAEGVEEICANAFNGMVNVTEVVLPSTLKEIGLAAFGSDNAIETIWSNAAVAPTILWQSNIESNKHPFTQTVRDNAVVFVTTNYKNYTEAEKWKEFANIYGLYPIQKTGYSLLVKVNEDVCSVEIGDKPHQNARIELELPRTIEYYGTVRDVTSIAKGGFKSCMFFGTLTIPGNIKTIADNAFNTCNKFDKLVIEEGVEELGNKAFYFASSLQSITLPSTLTKVGENCFGIIYSPAEQQPHGYLTHVISFATEPAALGTDAFTGNVETHTPLYVFDSSIETYKARPEWKNFENIRPIEAKIGETYYLTLNEAITAAESGQTITLLADVKAADGTPVTIPAGVTLDINTHNVTANIYGTVKTSGGLWTTVTVPGFNSRKMLGNGAIYNTTDATVANSATKVEMLAGSIVLNPNPETEWWTLPNQNLSIASGASFEVPANIKFTVRENTHVVVDGTLTVNGVVYLQKDATVKAAAGLNILTDVEGYMVSYEDGVYSVVQAIFTQTTQLGKGWNWFSYYVETDLAELENALGTNGVVIKTHGGGYTMYDGEDWFGSLTKLMPERMYQIKINEKQKISLDGKLIVSSEHPIRIKKGWNPIGYILDKSQAVGDALKSIIAVEGDRIVAQQGYAEYDGEGWFGTLNTLSPGKGYMYHSKYEGPDDNILIYSPSSKSELRANVTTDNNHWIPSAGQYANNMTMTAMVNVEGNYEIAAFVNGEVRGSARPVYVEALDSYIYFLTIHGDEVEEMSFRLYDLDTDIEYNLSDRMNYSDNAMVGSLTEPYMFNLEMLGIGENSAESFNIYPNPTTTNAEINLNATCDKVEVFNALGVKIAEYSNVDSIDAVETAGIYVIRVTDNGNVQHCRLIVK